MISINTILNRVHELGQPEQRPVARLGLTRTWGVACAALETVSLLFAPFYIVRAFTSCTVESFCALMHEILPESEMFKKADDQRVGFRKFTTTCVETAKLIAGLASTLFFGILVSPEINFRVHLKLELAVDNFSVKKQKEMQAKLNAEMYAKEIAEMRTARFAAFEEKRDAKWAADRQELAIDARLADLILHQAL